MNAVVAEFIGPDFIGKLADTQLGNGLETDAAALRANSTAWHKDRATIERQEAELQSLRDKLATITAAANA